MHQIGQAFLVCCWGGCCGTAWGVVFGCFMTISSIFTLILSNTVLLALSQKQEIHYAFLWLLLSSSQNAVAVIRQESENVLQACSWPLTGSL